ncbi:MAG: hypothetical protein KDD60_02425, partial [Bdellovibrionales bacterium]|nr:hypothetical protein [Bdellovibrionales bacterium]
MGATPNRKGFFCFSLRSERNSSSERNQELKQVIERPLVTIGRRFDRKAHSSATCEFSGGGVFVNGFLKGFLSGKSFPAILGCIALSSVFAVSGCSTSAPSSIEVVGLSDDAAGLESQNIGSDEEQRSALNSSDPIVLSSLEDGLGVEMRTSPSQVDLIVRSDRNGIDYQIERLADPARIQVRLANVSANSVTDTVAVAIENSPILTGISLATEGSDSEIEIQLSEGQAVSYESEPVAGNIYITLSRETDNLQALQMADESVMAAPNALEITSAQDSAAQVIDDSELVAGASTVDVPAAVSVPTARAASAKPVLRTVSFKQLPEVGEVVVAEMDAAGMFTMQRTAPSEYVLRLENASFDPQQVRTLLAPPSTNGIRSVRAVQDGNDTLLRIFASPTLTLEADTRGSNIIVRPSNQLSSRMPYLAGGQDRVRAQGELDNAIESGEVELNGESDNELSDLESEVSSLLDEAPKYTGRKISLDLQDT